MNWKNALTDGGPHDKDQVLISVDGVYYIAIYYDSDKSFKVYENLKTIRFEVEKHTIYWTDFNDPK
jgi:hypothetical protein